MVIVPLESSSSRAFDPCQVAFLAVLPAIAAHASAAFRHLRCHDREDAVAEVIAQAWASFRRHFTPDAPKPTNPKRLSRYAVYRVRRGQSTHNHRTMRFFNR